MKRCRTCNRTYTDPNLSYCIDDGTPLTTDAAGDESTVVSPSSPNGRSTEEARNAVAYRPPSGYVPPGTMPPGKRRRAWPWIVGILAAFILGVVGLMIAAAIFVPRWVRSRQPVIVTTNTNTDTAETDPAEDANVPAPTDKAEVLAQLTDIENEWTAANTNADKRKLNQILADDYVGPAPGGGLQGKREYINTIQRDTSIERWEFSDLKVELSGDRATLTGVITLFASGQPTALDFTDKFVWRSGRWQATGSVVQRREQTQADVNNH
jgi:uncharacterized protein DUF4440